MSRILEKIVEEMKANETQAELPIEVVRFSYKEENKEQLFA